MQDGKTAHNARHRGGSGSIAYDPVSKALHWATAILVLATFALAIWPELVKGSGALHRSLGLALLFVVPLRLAWRLAGGTGGTEAQAEDGLAGLATLAAKAVHGALYLAMAALPLLGWLYMDLKGTGASMFGQALPSLAGADRELAAAVYRVKWWLAYGMLGTIGLHAAAALAHHYLLRDGVLAAMLPDLRPRRRRPDAPRPAGLGEAAAGDTSPLAQPPLASATRR